MAALVAALPGYVALVAASGETYATSKAWSHELPGVDALEGLDGRTVLQALQRDQREGQVVIPRSGVVYPAKWAAHSAAPVLDGGWFVTLDLQAPGPDDRFRSVFHAMFQFIGLMTPDGTLVEVNDTALRAADLTQADVIGKKIWDTPGFGISEDAREQVRADVAAAAGGAFVRREITLQGPSRKSIVVDFSIIPLRGERGSVGQLIVEVRDVQDLAETRALLQQESKAGARFSEHLENLYRISTTAYPSSDALLRDVLRLGREMLNLPLAGINKFLGTECTYEIVTPQTEQVYEGAVLNLEDTLCYFVKEKGGTVAYPDLDTASDLHSHYAYHTLNVRAYVGTPLLVKGKLYGAIFFAGSRARTPFEDSALKMIELMARRIERALEREQADAALHATQERLLHAQRLARLGSWQWNTATDEVTWSDELYYIFGLPVGERIDFERYFERVHPDDRATLQASVERALATGESYTTSHRVVRPDGTVGYVEGSGDVTRNTDGQVLLFGTTQDVSERVRAMEALRESEQRYRFLTDYGTDIVSRVRPDGVITYISPAVETILGRTPDEIVGLGPADLLHPDDLERAYQVMANPVSELRTFRYRMRHGEDGRWVWLEARFQTFIDFDTGAVTGYISSARDVSAQVAYEDVLRRRASRMRLLTQITSEAALSTDEQVRRAVRLATEELGLDAGVLARKNNRRHLIRAAYAPDLGLKGGDSFSLPPEAMVVGPETDEAVAVGDLSTDAPAHPAYARFGYHGYIGAPIRVRGAFYGSLAFWSREAREGFSAEDREFVQLLGLWMGALLEKAMAEVQVRNSRNLLQSLLTSSLDGIMGFEAVRDEAGEIVDFTWLITNPRADEIAGRPNGELVGKRLLTEMPGNVETGLFDAYKKVVETGEPFVSEFSYFQDGVSGWFYSTAAKLEDGFFVTFRDITNIRAAADALRESEARFRLIAENMQDLVCQHATDGTYTYVSPSVQVMLGYEPDELLGKNPYELFHPEDAQRIREGSHAAVLEGETPTSTYRIRRKDGEYRWFETVSRPIVDEDGHVQHLQTVSRDVTDRVSGERELARAYQVLQQRNRELQDFAYVASHDLQEPLRKIRAFADLLVRDHNDALGADGQHYLSRIDDAASRMATLISDLLTFSRVTTKGQPFRTVDLAEIIDDMLQDLEMALRESEGRVDIGTLPSLEADPLQMRQLFQNLIGNALKFRREGVVPHVEVRAQVRRAPDSGHESILIEVADNGVGFDEKYLDRIFTPFQRLHGRHQYAGTGMGLAICRRIVERHQGQITARSTPDEGTTFIITLPRTHSSNPDVIS